MMQIKNSLTLLFLLSLCFCCESLFAQQWSFYRGPNSDGTAATTAKLQGQLKVHWKVPTNLGFSSFSLADGKALTVVTKGKREQCVALDIETGEELWTAPLGSNKYQRGGDSGARNNKGGDGPRSTPTIKDGLVYIYDAHMKLYCLKLENGNTVWSQDILNDYKGINIKWQSAASPVVDDKRVFVPGGGPGHSMLAFNRTNGELIWKTGSETMTHATPLLTSMGGTDQILFFMQSGIFALNPETGEQLWKTPFPYKTSTAAAPVVFKDFVYASAGYGVGAKLFQVNGASVEKKWEKPNRLQNHWSTPVFYKGHIYGMFSFKRYGRGPMKCIDPLTGEEKWSKEGYGPGNCILVNDKLVTLSDSGELVIVEATPDAYKEISRDKVLAGKCWSMPAIDNGKIYLRSTSEGACVSFE